MVAGHRPHGRLAVGLHYRRPHVSIARALLFVRFVIIWLKWMPGRLWKIVPSRFFRSRVTRAASEPESGGR
jgi:hypothetical protein